MMMTLPPQTAIVPCATAQQQGQQPNQDGQQQQQQEEEPEFKDEIAYSKGRETT